MLGAMSRSIDTLDRFRLPEHTGENRCLPCTVVNSVVAVVVASGVAKLWLPAGALALAVSVTAIYFRGYLVPGTPELTRRSPRLLALLGKEQADDVREASTRSGADTTGSTDWSERPETEQLLEFSGVVEACDDADDIRLTEKFREVWWRRIRRFRDDEGRALAQLAAVVGTDPAALEFVREDQQFGVARDGTFVTEWVSEAAFYADLAAEPTLSEWVPDWERLSDGKRTELIAGLRAFLEVCPACEADLEQVETVQDSCCSSVVVGVSVDCSECGAAVFNGSYR